jgi:hypothetical protein
MHIIKSLNDSLLPELLIGRVSFQTEDGTIRAERQESGSFYVWHHTPGQPDLCLLTYTVGRHAWVDVPNVPAELQPLVTTLRDALHGTGGGMS